MSERIYIGSLRKKFIWWNPFTWISSIIRKASGRKWSHSFLLHIDKDGIFSIIESDTKGVELTPLGDRWMKGKTVKIWDPILTKDVEDIQVMNEAVSHIGKKYDYKGTLIDQMWFQIRIKWAKAFDLPTPRWTGHTEAFATDKFYCSEFVGYVWNKVTGFFKLWKQMTPGDIDEECSTFCICRYEGNDWREMVQQILASHDY